MATGVNTNVTTAECELLGRGPVQGSADSDSLVALARQLCKQQQRDRLPGRRCTVSCSRDVGLEIVPHVQHQQQHHQQHRKRPDDEGFESDEDLASLGSYEDPNKRKIGGTLAAASVAAGASSDSANSSGVSEDSDDADAASLKGRQPQAAAVETAQGGVGGGGRETYGLADVAFCHTDAVALPGVAVWVIKTKRTPVAGLEAIVVRCCRDNRLQNVCRAYQEHSRRLKLEPKPWTGLHVHGSNVAGAGATSSTTAFQKRGKVVGVSNVTLTATPDVNRYSLVQRTDTDGVTHIEVTAGPPSKSAASPSARRVTGRRDGSPSSIISISTPESPSRKVSSGRDRFPEDGVRDDEDDDDDDDDDDGGGDRSPPQRPERRKYKAKPENGCVSDDFGRQQKVVRGQFIRVNVNHQCPVSPEPERKSARPPSAAAPCNSPLSSAAASDRLWSTADYDRLDGRYGEHRRSSRPANTGRTRSRSTGPGRRQQQPLQLTAVGQHPPPPPPVAFSRYPPAAVEPHTTTTTTTPQSFGARFFGKLRDMTSANQDAQPVTFRRRNSVGESATANFYQYFGHHHQQQHHYGQYQQQLQNYQKQQAIKNGGNLKSVIKKNNKSQPYQQHAYDEPKKVTFSAYATVQVVD